LLRIQLEATAKASRVAERAFADLTGHAYSYRFEVSDEDVKAKFKQLRERIRSLGSIGPHMVVGENDDDEASVAARKAAAENIENPCWKGLQDLIFSPGSTYRVGQSGSSIWEAFETMIGLSLCTLPRNNPL
jgi:hypothetical protein